MATRGCVRVTVKLEEQFYSVYGHSLAHRPRRMSILSRRSNHRPLASLPHRSACAQRRTFTNLPSPSDSDGSNKTTNRKLSSSSPSNLRPPIQSSLFSNFSSLLSSASAASPSGTAPPLTIHASRVLPYSRVALFELISDISSYPHFIPFCTGAEVHSHSGTATPPPSNNNTNSTNSNSNATPSTPRRWPASATLTVGFAGYSESYLSRVYCLPYEAVEAVSGAEARCSLTDGADKDENRLAHYEGVQVDDPDPRNELFSSLRARWTLVDAGADAGAGPRTKISLAIEAHWKNQLLAAVSREVAPGVAGRIVDAFERRAGEVLG